MRGRTMTDEQIEELKMQIVAYATITEQLVELHKAATSQQGVGVGNMHSEPTAASSSHKLTCARQRWNPTAVQVQILERIFDEGMETPNKQKIMEIAAECCQYGQISETNVYNWFQNRRARSKRRQSISSSTPNVVANHSSVNTIPIQLESAAANRTGSNTNPIDLKSNSVPTLFPSHESFQPYESLSHLAQYESEDERSRIAQFLGEMEVAASPYQCGENYNMNGSHQDDA